MTTRKTPVEKARAKYLAAAKRTLSQVVTAAAEHAAALDGGGVPAGSFMTHVLRYQAALTSLDTLDALGDVAVAGPPDGDDGLAEVSRDDLRTMIAVIRGVVPANMLGNGDTPLSRLEDAAAGPPWETVPPPDAEPPQ